MAAPTPRRVLAATLVPVALLVDLVATAGPAGAHNVGGGSLPAPPWLLSYIGVFAMAVTAVALRASWTTPRLSRFALSSEAAEEAGPPVATARPWPTIGQLLGILVMAGVLVASEVGPDSAAANVTPVAVLVVWFVGMPIVALVLGDVVGAINPFVGVVRIVRLVRPAAPPGEVERTPPPSWTAAAFLGSFSWFFLAYHTPGSPRALAVFLAGYTIAAVAGGLWWGAEWLRTGEGFGALSAAVARLSPRGCRRSVDGLTALVVVWVGGTCFDGLSNTPFWIDVLGTTRGWGRAGLNTVGLVWMIAVAAGVVLVAFRVVDRVRGNTLLASMGVALVPLGLGWFIAHDLTLLLFEGQNFLALVSDPLGRGWDLFGTINRTIDYTLVTARWVRWVQLISLVVGHVGTVLVAHDLALRTVGRRNGMAVTWAVTAVAAASLVGAVLLVLK